MGNYRLEKVYSFWDNISAGVFKSDEKTIIAIDTNGNGLDPNDVFIAEDGSQSKAPSGDELTKWNSALRRWAGTEARRDYAQVKITTGDCVQDWTDATRPGERDYVPFDPPLSPQKEKKKEIVGAKNPLAKNPFDCLAATGSIQAGENDRIVVKAGSPFIHVEGDLKLIESQSPIGRSDLEESIHIVVSDNVKDPNPEKRSPIRYFYYQKPR